MLRFISPWCFFNLVMFFSYWLFCSLVWLHIVILFFYSCVVFHTLLWCSFGIVVVFLSHCYSYFHSSQVIASFFSHYYLCFSCVVVSLFSCFCFILLPLLLLMFFFALMSHSSHITVAYVFFMLLLHSSHIVALLFWHCQVVFLVLMQCSFRTVVILLALFALLPCSSRTIAPTFLILLLHFSYIITFALLTLLFCFSRTIVSTFLTLPCSSHIVTFVLLTLLPHYFQIVVFVLLTLLPLFFSRCCLSFLALLPRSSCATTFVFLTLLLHSFSIVTLHIIFNLQVPIGTTLDVVFLVSFLFPTLVWYFPSHVQVEARAPSSWAPKVNFFKFFFFFFHFFKNDFAKMCHYR